MSSNLLTLRKEIERVQKIVQGHKNRLKKLEAAVSNWHRNHEYNYTRKDLEEAITYLESVERDLKAAEHAWVGQRLLIAAQVYSSCSGLEDAVSTADKLMCANLRAAIGETLDSPP